MKDLITPHLDLIDSILGVEGVPVQRRPISAALRFVRDFILQIRTGTEMERTPGEPKDFVSEPWFRALYSVVEDWYGTRYSTRMQTTHSKFLRCVTLIDTTPFELRVQTTLVTPAKPGETIRLSFPDTLVDGEDPMTWLRNPPNYDSYPPDSIAEATATTATIATLARKVASRLIGARADHEVARNILSGVRLHLQSAASLILQEDEDGSFARAEWELQMACECILKALLQQRSGRFPESHDLFYLYDQCAEWIPSVDRGLIKRLPRWDEAANLRYGLGDHPTIIGIFDWYRTALELIGGAAGSLQRVLTESAWIEVRKAPWLSDRTQQPSV